jgi:acetyl-CoA C-acetyltransferase
MGHPAEVALGVLMPTQCYPMFETALRHRAGHDAAEHQRFLGDLWAGFAAVAAENPYAWDRSGPSADEIATVTAENRIIGYPYTKRMVSNPDVDMSSAVILCSAAEAHARGIARDRWVFPWSGTDGADPYLSTRPSLTGSSAMRVAGGAALELAGVGIADVAHLDLYSCFPSAVQLAAIELGIGLDRQLTVYGGLPFAGGPWNNPVGHAIAAMVDVLRSDAGSVGLVTANGGIVQKHAFGVYSASPPPSGGFRHSHPQFAIDAAGPPIELADGYAGPAEIESWTVMHERDGSRARAHATVRTTDGARAWAVTNEPDLMAHLEDIDAIGAAATVGPDAELRMA